MSSMLKKSAVLLGLVAASFSATAEQVSFQYDVEVGMAQQKYDAQLMLNASLEQSIYNSAYHALLADVTLPGRRPVVTIKDVQNKDSEEE